MFWIFFAGPPRPDRRFCDPDKKKLGGWGFGSTSERIGTFRVMNVRSRTLTNNPEHSGNKKKLDFFGWFLDFMGKFLDFVV